MICAGDNGKGACLGILLGPWRTSKGLLIGMVSQGKACSDTGCIGLYTEVSYFVGWIQETMSKVRKAENSANNGSVKVGSGVYTLNPLSSNRVVYPALFL